MRGNGRVLMILVVVVLLIGGGVRAAFLFYPSLPDPADANRDELLQWLVVRDLRDESPETLEVLGQRLEEEFSTGFDWETEENRLDESQRERVCDNVVVLMKPWFLGKTRRYFQLADDRRPAFLDKLIDTMTVWNEVDSLRPAAASGGQGGLLVTLAEEMEQWKREANPAERERIEEFSRAIQVQLLRRMLPMSSAAP